MSASDVAAKRIREARTKRGWTVKDLAGACAKAGVPNLTAPVITNLETRRRPGREITAEELLALAWVLDVPPVQLLSPLDAGEALRVVPGEEKGPLEAAEWLADEDTVLEAVRPAASAMERNTERILRYRASPLTVLRQFRVAVRTLRYHDRMLELCLQQDVPEEAAVNLSRNSVTVMALRLLHLAASMEALGYAPPMDGVAEILARHGFPATLAEWEKLLAEEQAAGGEPDEGP